MVSLRTFRVLGHVYAGFTIIGALFSIGYYFNPEREVTLHMSGYIDEKGNIVDNPTNNDVITNDVNEIRLVEAGKVDLRETKTPPEVYLAAGIIQLLLTTMFVVGVETATLGLVRLYRNLFVFSALCSMVKLVRDCGLALDSGEDDLINYEFGVAAFTVGIVALGWWILNGVIRYVENERITRNIILVITPQTDTKALI